MALTQTTTTGAGNASAEISNLVKTMYETELLDRAVASFPHARFGVSASLARGKGGQLEWRRFDALSAVTTALTETTSPDSTQITVTDIQATPAEYGAWVSYTRLLEFRSIDPFIMETSQVLGEQCGDSIDQITRDVLVSGFTVIQYAGGGTTIGAIASTDYITFDEIVLAVATLRAANARPFENGMFRGITHPHVCADLAIDGDVQKLFDNRGRMAADNPYETGYAGSIWKVDVYESSNSKIEEQSGAPDVYDFHIIGRQAYGVAGLAESEVRMPEPGEPGDNTGAQFSSPVELIVRELGWNDALRRFGALGWYATHVAKVLNANFAVRLRGASRLGSAT